MKTLKITELRRWAKENNLPDEWWYCVNGDVKPEMAKIGEIERDGTIQVMNVAAQGCELEEWFLFRYPGFRTEEEIQDAEEKKRKRNEATEKQKVALEFMGHPTEGVTKLEASELIEKYFRSDTYDSFIEGPKYADYKWSQRPRIFSPRQILREQFSRLQNISYEVRQSVSDSRRDKLLDLAHEQGIDEYSLAEFLRQQDPKLFVADSTRRKKQNEAAIWQEVSEQMRIEEQTDARRRGPARVSTGVTEKPDGCFSLIVCAGLAIAGFVDLLFFQ